MKIVTAFDSFKGCITAAQACHAAAQGLASRYPQAVIEEIPLSDGGEGLVQCVQSILPVRMVTLQAHGPLMEPLQASYAVSLDGTTAYMEMASTSGLPLVPLAQRNPMLTTTYGVGDLIAHAIGQGCSQIIMGIGGSATNDGGQGMLQSLQDKGFLGSEGNHYGQILNDRLRQCHFLVACDVDNPLCGPRGASRIFGPQKGATPQQVAQLDALLQAFADRTVSAGIATPQLANYPGTGAAGGLGYGLMAYLKAQLQSGIDIILDIVDFDRRIQGADVVLTGEGKSDEQTLMGKVPHGVLRHASAQSIPVCLLSGAIDDPNQNLSRSFREVRSINEGDPRPLQTLMTPAVAMSNLMNTSAHLKDFQ